MEVVIGVPGGPLKPIPFPIPKLPYLYPLTPNVPSPIQIPKGPRHCRLGFPLGIHKRAHGEPSVA